MELYYKEDELVNLIDTLESLVDNSEYYKQFNDVLNDIRFQAGDILETVREKIENQERKEYEAEQREFINSRI